MGFGTLFKQQDVLTNLSNSMAESAGQQQQDAYNKEAEALREQANVAQEQTAQDVALYRRQSNIQAGQVTEQYLSSGVQDVGTPLAQTDEIRRLADFKIKAMQEQGKLQEDLLMSQSEIAQNTGLAARQHASGQALENTLSNQIQQYQTKQNFYKGLFGGIASGALSILPGAAGTVAKFGQGFLQGALGR